MLIMHLHNKTDEKITSQVSRIFIMYKTLVKQIKELEKTKGNSDDSEENKNILLKIEEYQIELKKIRDKFPEGFFDEFI